MEAAASFSAPSALEAILPDDGEATRATVKDKWQGAVTAGSGFVAIPMALLRLQKSLGLSAVDLVVLVNLLAHWWEPDKAVYPRSTTIARRMGVTKRTVQRAMQTLIQKNLVTRTYQDDGKRVFRFEPLVRQLAGDITSAYALQRRESFDA